MKEIDKLISRGRLTDMDTEDQYYYPLFLNNKEQLEKELKIDEDNIKVVRTFIYGEDSKRKLKIDIINNKILIYKSSMQVVYIIDKYQAVSKFYNEILKFAKKYSLQEKLKEKN